MPTAVEKLEAFIEAIRREADAEGYARATRDLDASVQKALADFKGGAGTPSMTTMTVNLPRDRVSYKVTKRNPRGQNRHLVLKTLKDANRALAATDIMRFLQLMEGAKVAYSSTRHALDQLTASGDVVEVSPGMWKVKEEMVPPTEIEGTMRFTG